LKYTPHVARYSDHHCRIWHFGKTKRYQPKSITVVHLMINVYCAPCTGHWLLRSKAIRCYKVNWRSGTHSERDRETYIIHFHICSRCMSYIYMILPCVCFYTCVALCTGATGWGRGYRGWERERGCNVTNRHHRWKGCQSYIITGVLQSDQRAIWRGYCQLQFVLVVDYFCWTFPMLNKLFGATSMFHVRQYFDDTCPKSVSRSITSFVTIISMQHW